MLTLTPSWIQSARRLLPVFFMVIGMLFPAIGNAQEKNTEPKKNLKYASTTSLSLVLTHGNKEDFSFSLDTDQNLEFHKNRINFKGRFIVSSSNGEKTAEIYYSQLKFDRKIKSRAYLLGFARYERNKLSGYLFRIALSAGAGISWTKGPKHQLTSELAFGWNNERENQRNAVNGLCPQSQVCEQILSSSFLASIMTHKWVGQISESAKIVLQETLFWNLEELKDIRLNSYFEISSSINRHLGLKTSFQVIYERQPVASYKSTDIFILSSLVLQF